MYEFDEAVLLSDGIVMMSSGSAATIGEALTCPGRATANRDIFPADLALYSSVPVGMPSTSRRATGDAAYSARRGGVLCPLCDLPFTILQVISDVYNHRIASASYLH
jgi:hypothetical protein